MLLLWYCLVNSIDRKDTSSPLIFEIELNSTGVLADIDKIIPIQPRRLSFKVTSMICY